MSPFYYCVGNPELQTLKRPATTGYQFRVSAVLLHVHVCVPETHRVHVHVHVGTCMYIRTCTCTLLLKIKCSQFSTELCGTAHEKSSIQEPQLHPLH